MEIKDLGDLFAPAALGMRVDRKEALAQKGAEKKKFTLYTELVTNERVRSVAYSPAHGALRSAPSVEELRDRRRDGADVRAVNKCAEPPTLRSHALRHTPDIGSDVLLSQSTDRDTGNPLKTPSP